MNNKNQISYAALGNRVNRSDSKTTLLRKVATWIRNFLENAE